MTEAALHISLLGEFSLVVAGEAAVSFSGDRPISLLAYLLLHRHTPVSRQHLAFTLWPDSSDSQARANLRNLFYTLRQTLPRADEYLAADTMTLQWRNDTDFTLDVAAFEAALGAAKAADAAQDEVAHLETAVGLYKGDLLPSNYDDWIVPLREELRQNYLDALHRLVSLLEQQGAYRAAARYAQRLLLQDPLDETAYVQLMRLHARSGDRAGVRRVYESCVATLRRELDVEPSRATQAAYEQLMRLEASPAVVAPMAAPIAAEDSEPEQIAGPTSRPRPLPQAPTRFIGREAEIAQVAELVANPDCRLLTITGPGGIGKTRLALQTAVGHQRVFADGVAFVPLDGVNESIYVAPAIGSALNLTFSGQTEPKVQLFQHLRDKQMLLVLDNLEQLAEEIGVLAELLEAAPGVVLVVTSRERLGLREEWLFALDGLPTPQAQEMSTPAAVAENPAVRLFLQSATRVRPGFAPDAGELQAIARICGLVSGLPLGLELAATWVRLLSAAEIAAELEQGIDFLAAAHRNVPARHQSIRAVFDYSWQLLTPEERGLFARLSVFRGGFTREAAQQVAGATLPLLASLADQSFVRPPQSGRYTVHELLRQYAVEQLAAQPAQQQATAERYSTYYLTLLEAAETALVSARQREVVAQFTGDMGNLLRAWEWAAEQGQLAHLRAASWTLWYFFELEGAFQEGESAFQRAEVALQEAVLRANSPAAELLITLANIRTHRAYFSFRRGNSTAALQTLNEVIDLLRRHDDEEALADALLLRGSMHWFAQQYAAAADVTREALELSRQQQRPWQIMIHTTTLGVMEHELGDYEAAYRLLREGLAQAQALGDPHSITFASSFLSRTAQTLGYTTETTALLQQSLAQARESNDRFVIGIALEQLALGALAQGQREEAYRSFEESIALYREMGDERSLARMLLRLADARAEAGDVTQAQAHYREALATAAAGEAWPTVFHTLRGLAQLHAEAGDSVQTWALTAVLLREPAPPEVREAAEAVQNAVQPELTPEAREAVHTWLGKRPLPALIDDILQNKLPT